ncbi:ABC transporter ATP-binding protein [Oceanobacillus sp. FSL H7-0719]|uniref:ABC transporter ATP-binding protein n=1 Tax=Oceanobacillus sp. FSL H7-0719 TaxID=2954507 RepID=UPI00324CAE81
MVLHCQLTAAGYSKREPVLENIQFTVQPGELVGLIGPNGAGKSSTIKSLLGVIDYVDGKIDLENYAYIPERPFFYPGLTLMEHLHFLLSTLEIEEKEFIKRMQKMLREFQLEKVVHQYPDSYSKGMQQKAMIMLAFLQQPKVHIIDEPFMGLDPTVVRKLLDMIEWEKQRGAGILMSTHVLDTAEKICDRFLLISHGKLIAEGTLTDIQKKSELPDASLFDCFHILTERGEVNDRLGII